MPRCEAVFLLLNSEYSVSPFQANQRNRIQQPRPRLQPNQSISQSGSQQPATVEILCKPEENAESFLDRPIPKASRVQPLPSGQGEPKSNT